ncbi:MAG: DMT family transporter [Candidatus Poseidonia sp.]|nr:DMT family transporter [Poseidonia sp.]
MKHAAVHFKLFLVATIWGFGWPAGRVVALDTPPVLASWLRYVVACLCFLAYLNLRKAFVLPSRRQWKGIALIGFCSTFLYQLFFMLGMARTAAGDASLMITLNPLFTAILASLFLKESFTKRHTLGVALGFSGVLVLFLASPNTNLVTTERWLGNGFIACSALSWASATILMKNLMTDTDEEAGMTPLLLTVWSSLAGLLFLTPFLVGELVQQGEIHRPSVEAWYGIVFLAILSTVVSYVWFADGVNKIGAGKAALYVYLIPPFGILGGFILLDEQLGLSLFASFALIAGGVAIAQSEKRHEQEAGLTEHGH